MGLEYHVDEIIKEFDPDLRQHYYWEDGLVVEEGYIAEAIMFVLDESGSFGPTRYNPQTQKIEFGKHRMFYNSLPGAYEKYCSEFMSLYTLQ